MFVQALRSDFGVNFRSGTGNQEETLRDDFRFPAVGLVWLGKRKDSARTGLAAHPPGTITLCAY